MTENDRKLPECQHIAKMHLMSDLFSCTLTGSILILVYTHFLSRATRPISHRVVWSVGPSVPIYYFGIFELLEGRIARVSYDCLCPCTNHFSPCPAHYCPCPNHYCPCPTARDWSSRVYGLVVYNALLISIRSNTFESPLEIQV